MFIEHIKLNGTKRFTPPCFSDARGFFTETHSLLALLDSPFEIEG